MAEVSATGAEDKIAQTAPSAPTEAGTDPNLVNLKPEAGARQEWWPEGVNSEDELRAYVEGLNKPPAEGEVKDPAAKTEDATTEEEKPPVRTVEEIKESLQKAGGIYADPRYEPLAIEVEQTGSLKPESIAKAAADFNVPEDFVKAFVDNAMAAREAAGLKASSTQSQADAQAAATITSVFTGENGPAEYEAFIAWGQQNLSLPEKQAYDGALARGDQIAAKALLETYSTRFKAEGNTQRRDITAGVTKAPAPAPEGGTKPFASLEEGRSAMGSRKYDQDPAYRAEVDARYAITPGS